MHDDGPSKGDPTTLLIIKICFIVVVFLIAVISGILPAKIKSCGQNPTFMGLANSFSGGLFLAIALVHILPEVVEEYNEWANPDEHHHHDDPETGKLTHYKLGHGDGEEHAFPLPFILVFAGYTFILLIDRVMFDSHSLFDHGHGHGHGHGDHGHGHGDHAHEHEDDEKHDHHQSHHHDTINDPATTKLIKGIRKSMIIKDNFQA